MTTSFSSSMKQIPCHRRILGGSSAGPLRTSQDCRWCNTGRGVVRLGYQIDVASLDAFQSPRCDMVSCFSVHAKICSEARDGMRLERLIRYAARRRNASGFDNPADPTYKTIDLTIPRNPNYAPLYPDDPSTAHHPPCP